MNEAWWLSHEATIRLSIYFLVLSAMAIWEQFSIAITPTRHKPLRWLNNIALASSGGVLIRLVLPVTAVGAASVAQEEHFGLFYNIPFWLNITFSIVLLDFLIYWQHRLFHKHSLLWRVHGTHHVDPEVDASTGARFHPIEIFLSMLIKISAVVLLGCSPMSVFVFEIILNASATFNHGNIELPKSMKKAIEPFLVTPEMHRVHHSVVPTETNSNFGFCLSIWDRIFGTMSITDSAKKETIKLGLPTKSGDTFGQSLVDLLIFPFKYKP